MTHLNRNFLSRVVVLIVSIGITQSSAASETLVFVGDRHDTFEDTYQYSTVKHEFVVRNTTTHPITIVEGIAVSGTGEVTFEPTPVPPGKTASIHVRQPVGNSLGITAFRFAIVTDEPDRPKHRFSLSGFVQSPYDPESIHVDLGFVDRQNPVAGRGRFELYSREVDKLHLTTTASENQQIAVEAAPVGFVAEGLELTVTPSTKLPRGRLFGAATLMTNVPSQPRLDFTYAANVFDDVAPTENPVAFGLIRVGQEAIKIITVESRSGTPFAIDDASNTIGGILNVSWNPCDGRDSDTSPCFRVQFSLSPEKEQVTSGAVNLQISGDPLPVPIMVTSWVVSPETVVKQFGSTTQPNPGGSP